MRLCLGWIYRNLPCGEAQWHFPDIPGQSPHECLPVLEQPAPETAQSDLRIHDLRRTFASFLANAGHQLYDAQKMLGTRIRVRPCAMPILNKRRSARQPRMWARFSQAHEALVGTEPRHVSTLQPRGTHFREARGRTKKALLTPLLPDSLMMI